jgi:hypothetical protein
VALSNSPVFVQTPKLSTAQIAVGDTTALKAVVTAGATQPIKVVGLFAVSSDTAAKIIQISITDTSASLTNIIGTVAIPALSGFDGTASAVDLLRGGPNNLMPYLPIDNDGQAYFFLEATDILKVNAIATVTSGKFLYITAIAGEF